LYIWEEKGCGSRPEEGQALTDKSPSLIQPYQPFSLIANASSALDPTISHPFHRQI
jgi:hypothetical protein